MLFSKATVVLCRRGGGGGGGRRGGGLNTKIWLSYKEDFDFTNTRHSM